MVVYTKLMSNLEWISYGEEDEKGAFILDKKHYKITTNNILRVIAMGNLKYYDGKSECIPNIIQHNGFGTELVSLYVIRYMLNNNYRGVYGDGFIEGTELLNNLVDLLCGSNSQISNRSKWSSLFGGAIAYLYNKGILFRSLYDIETEDPSMIKRQYDNSYKLYLSPRGEMLYNLLATNGVLMEIYRDDVATEIKNNDKISSELNATERFIYSLNMVEWLFGIEQSIAVQCFWNIKKYIDYIGKSFISTHILLGVASNIKLYYTENKTEQQDEVVGKIETITNKMKNYVDQINGLYGNSFTSEEIEAKQNIIEEVANQEKD